MNDTLRRQELNNCTFVKTALMLIVVAYHSILFWGGNWFTKDPALAAPAMKLLARWLNSFHIYGFALVSGYLFAYIKGEKGGYGRYVPFLLGKARRLLIPYGFWAVCWAIPVQVLFLGTDLPALLRTFALGTAPAQLWFLLMLFGVFAMFWPLSKWLEKKPLLLAAAVLAAYGVGTVGSIALPNAAQVFTAMRYLLVFYIGWLLRTGGSKPVRKIPAAVWVAASVAAFALTEFFGSRDGAVFTLLELAAEPVCHAIGAVMAFVTLQKLADKIQPNGPVWKFLGERSMAVYLLHQQVIYFTIAGLNGKLNPWLHGAVNFFLAMAVSLALASLLRKTKFTRCLIGEK